MKHLALSPLSFLVAMSCAATSGAARAQATTDDISTPVQRHGQLSVQGNRIVDKDGEPVILRGMSLFWSQWMGQFYNRAAVKWLRDDWRCSIVRAAMGVELGGYLENPEQEKRKVETVVDAAIKNGVYVVIDWHDHNANQHTAQAQQFFAAMARRYAGKPNVIYEVFNEPLAEASWKGDVKPYCEAVIASIRQYDLDNLIVCGSPSWSQKVDEAAADPIAGENIVYSLHFYASSHGQELRDAASRALKSGAALMVTEFGITEATGDGEINREEMQKWWEFLDDNGISWCNWSIADKVESSAALRPGASARGVWDETMLTPSGLFVRAKLREEYDRDATRVLADKKPAIADKVPAPKKTATP